MQNLVELNNLVLDDNQVFHHPEQENRDFDYSDGREVEQYLEKVFTEVSDLGSRSRELQERIIDWPSEYHLSSDRSNLLRPYDLSFASTALEFGSGCGAISRFLGEQGLEVDAVEGSAIRAALGRLRCRDLENVSVINANYNELAYPEKYYDLILFIGVLEYARKFHPEAASDREAVVAILQQVSSYLNPGGVILVAIENRLGLKYILGQHEDHYAKKYIGIHGYPDSAGIATYSEQEWRDLVTESGLAHCRFSFPFPDYKIPRVTFGEDFAGSANNAFNHLEGLYARDYTRPVKKSPTESIAWEAANSGRFLNTIANSFCLAVGNDRARIERIMDFDFCHMPGPGRKNRFAVLTRKKSGSDQVNKIPAGEIIAGDGRKPDGALRVTQVLENQTYLDGNLLSTEWLRAILIYSRREEFDALLKRYYEFLGEIENSGEPLKIDMLPINIIVDEDGSYQLFDQEWEINEPVSRDYLLFRALLTFIVTNWIHMKDFLGWLELHSVRDFVDYGFRNHHLPLARNLEEFVSLENRFQQATTNDAPDDGVQQLLDTRFDFTLDDRDIYSTLFWAGPGEEFHGSRSEEVELVPDPEWQTVVFKPKSLAGPVKSLRIDPFDIRKTDGVGFFSVSEIQAVVPGNPNNGATEKILWQLEGEKAVAENCVADCAWYAPLAESGFWLSSTDFPKMHFELNEPLELKQGETMEIRVKMRIAESPEYILAHQRYLSRIRQMEQTEADLKKTLHHLESARKEIAEIKAGRPFRFGMKVFSMLGFLKR